MQGWVVERDLLEVGVVEEDALRKDLKKAEPLLLEVLRLKILLSANLNQSQRAPLTGKNYKDSHQEYNHFMESVLVWVARYCGRVNKRSKGLKLSFSLAVLYGRAD